MRRLRPTGVAGVAAFLVLAVTAAGTAIAYFTTTGAGNSAAKTVAALTQPSIASAVPGAGGTVTLSWGAVAPPGSGSVTYKIERDGGGASGTCAPTLTATSCVDSGLLVGTYTYVVRAKWRSWTVSSTGKAATVTVGPVDRFVLSAASSTPTAGATDSLTITAKDAGGGTVTTYTGAKSLTFTGASASPEGAGPTVSDSSGADVAFGDPTAIDFSAGVATVGSGKNGAMKLYKSGSTSLKVGDGSLTTPTALTVTVSATATRFLLASSATSMTAGGSANLTITALDAYENTVSTYTGSKSLTFSGASASPSGTKPTVTNSSSTSGVAFGTATAITFTAGVATVSSSKNGLMKLYDAEEAAIVVSDGTISNATPLKVTVSPATTSKLVLAAATTTPAAGASDNLSTTAQDTYGNVTPSYTGAKTLTFTGASASPSGATPTVSDSSGADVPFGTAMQFDFSEGVASASDGKNGVMKLYRSGSTSVKVSDGSLSVTLTVTVAAGSAAKFLLASSLSALTAGSSSNLTTTAQDSYGNTATAYTGAKTLTYSGASTSPGGTAPVVVSSGNSPVALGSPTAINFTNGVASVSSSRNGLLRLYRAESASISVSDGTISSATVAITVSPTTATRWGITNINVSAGVLGSNCLFTCTLTGLGNSGKVTARVAVTDTYGNTVSGVGTGHGAKVTTNGSGSVSGTPLAIPSAGAAESATTFTFTSRSSGSFTEIVTVAASEGTAYTTATLTASK